MFLRAWARALCLVPLVIAILPVQPAGATAPATVDYPSASWAPADPSNYSTANRTHDHPIDMIVIHDIEGDAASAIRDFQTPNYSASAHYVVDYNGALTQMVLEKDIAWHAGNWDYNSRAIGIEHAGYACCNYYTTAEYNASAALAASICSRYGVPMDRAHVIGHSEVPDPNNPGLYGGSDHHTDPGAYWNWSYYMATAQADAASLPSPPHLMPDPVATPTAGGVNVTWQPARSCRKPITGYTVTAQPGGATQSLPANATSAAFTNLAAGTSYTFTVTAVDADGQDAQTSNAAAPGGCSAATLTATPASPRSVGTAVQLSAAAATCANPRYEFWMLAPGGVWTDVQPYSQTATYSWSTTGLAPGLYSFGVWVRDANSPGAYSNSSGTYDARFGIDYNLTPAPCGTTTASASPASQAMTGTTVTVTASSTACANPQYEFWLQSPDGTWRVAQPYSSKATFTWSTGGQPAGAYRFSVWARDAASAGLNGAAPNTYDSFDAFAYTLTGTNCASVTANVSPAGTATSGTAVTVAASALGCPNPRYEVWLLPPGGTWQLLQPYSSAGTITWSTAGRPAGSYRLSVWARDAASTAAYDAFSAFQYTLTAPSPCSSVTTTTSPSGSAAVNTPVTVTASAAGCANAQYEFWLLPPGGTWQLAQGYSANTTFKWSTAGKAAGTYRFSVWARDVSSGASYDAFNAFDYNLTVTPCTTLTAPVTPPSPSSAGTTVTINASASGCPSPQYEFWLKLPNGTWTLARGWSSSGTFTWSTAGLPAGTYRFSVWVRDSSSAASYDSFSAFDYTLN